MHMIQDHAQQTTVISQRRSQKTLTEQGASRTRGNAAFEAMEAATQARERQPEARRQNEQTYQDAGEAETIFNNNVRSPPVR